MSDDVSTEDTAGQSQTAGDAVDEQAPDVSQAAEELSLEPDENAPYGYMIDPDTGLRRAKIRAGRRRKAPAVPAGTPPPTAFDAKIKRDEDRAPGAGRDRARKKATKSRGGDKPEQPAAPPFRAGPIATGMNKLYARAGKIMRVWDNDIGQALISITRKESDDDTTVGEAWEEIARTNPRIRAFLLRMLEGSAWSSLFMAHAPVFLAVLMKENIRRHLPFNRLFSAFLDPDEEGPSEVSENLGGIQAQDMMQMMQAAQSMMGPMFDAMHLPRSVVIDPRTAPEQAEEPDQFSPPESKTA